MGKVGLGLREGAVKIGDCLTLTAVKFTFDLVDEDIAAPAVLDSLPDVPFTLNGVRKFVDDHTVMEPGNLCSSLLHKSSVRPSFGNSPHVLEIPGRESFHLGKFPAKIHGETVNDLGAPPLLLLSRENVAAYLPIEQYELSIY
jgi:hypothetical protein